jgi:Branched-chain amino acid transport protein
VVTLLYQKRNGFLLFYPKKCPKSERYANTFGTSSLYILSNKGEITLKKLDTLSIGLMLFSMFFGAGNLIFPPFLGAESGTSYWLAMSGFIPALACHL